MRIQAPTVWARSPINDRLQMEGSFVLDSMSGASPVYLSTLSGASGTGIDDTRRAGDTKLTYSFDRMSVAAGGSVSSEDDYLSRGGLIETKWWTADKNTTINAGVGASHDDIDSTLAPVLAEMRNTYSYGVGVTQIINPISLAQMQLNYNSADGYHSDPYKAFDSRPYSREQWAWLTRYIWYVAGAGASLHTDYRYYWDTWGVRSHTVEVSWHQEVGESWIVRPLVRYYSQDRAQFFSADFPPRDLEHFSSYDQRLADFGSISLGLKVSREVTSGISLQGSYEWAQQRASFKIGSHDSNEIEPFSMRFFSLGLLARF